MAAGALTGALYKSTGTNGFPQPLCLRFLINKKNFSPLAGVKPALAAASVISGVAGIWSYVKKSV
jgi:hypothetical protein